MACRTEGRSPWFIGLPDVGSGAPARCRRGASGVLRAEELRTRPIRPIFDDIEGFDNSTHRRASIAKVGPAEREDPKALPDP